ncbi:erythromycin esterase family protein [Nonomuraea zeae]|uniref:Erythromycin esterase family protein n=1 Tax=Nonomuraea zeae TaxID=1642303 RepID=A0A5S4G6H3_9ACTN|nr:erythromycin esterase family protein [Nonomuraea zeae]TMR28616.1 erythromycin esterase family protein [Nonomuraea zeae]
MADIPSLKDAALALSGDPGAAVERLLRTLPARPRLLGLGEATHGQGALEELRNQIFRHLVEHAGYRSFALESDCLSGLIVDDYVTEGKGTLDDVMRHGFSHGLGESPANRALVSWMREHNSTSPAADRLRFFGFDAPLEMMSAASPRQALTALHAYLAAHVDASLLPCTAESLGELLGPDEPWTNTAAAMDPAQSVGGSAAAVRLRLVADELQALLAAESPRLVPATSREEWWRANLYGRTATGLLRYHAGVAEPSPSRVARLLGVRDTMMADNLSAIAGGQAAPALVYAHNRHLQRDKSEWQLLDLALEWWSAGAIMDVRLGEEYAFVASALGSVPHRGLGAPDGDTIEGVLATLPGDAYVIDSAALTAALGDTVAGLVPRTETTSDHGYFALHPGALGRTDGLLFIKEVPAR